MATAFTRTSTNKSAGDQATAASYNALRTDLHDFLTLLFGNDTADTWADVGVIKLDTINEQTAGNGITADGVLLKDGNVTAGVVQANTNVKTDNIVEKTLNAGVTIDGLLLKDNAIVGSGNASFASLVASAAVLINGIQLSNGGQGLRLDANLDLNGNSIRGLNKAIDFLAGTGSSGSSIPLPSGYIESECQFMHAMRTASVGNGGTAICGVNISSSGRQGTVQRWEFGDAGYTNGGTYSYVIIGMHNRV